MWFSVCIPLINADVDGECRWIMLQADPTRAWVCVVCVSVSVLIVSVVLESKWMQHMVECDMRDCFGTCNCCRLRHHTLFIYFVIRPVVSIIPCIFSLYLSCWHCTTQTTGAWATRAEMPAWWIALWCLLVRVNAMKEEKMWNVLLSVENYCSSFPHLVDRILICSRHSLVYFEKKNWFSADNCFDSRDLHTLFEAEIDEVWGAPKRNIISWWRCGRSKSNYWNKPRD